jgi:hypothetical protein
MSLKFEVRSSKFKVTGLSEEIDNEYIRFEYYYYVETRNHEPGTRNIFHVSDIVPYNTMPIGMSGF